MYFSLEKLVDYKGNRYELARACMEYAKKVRILEIDEYHEVNGKDALVAIKALLDGKIKYTMDVIEDEDYDDIDDFQSTRNSENNKVEELDIDGEIG